jgi:hypothetical protein
MLGCPWCLKAVLDDDTIQVKDGVTWHARCKDLHDSAERSRRAKGMEIGCNAVKDTTIRYTMTPERFMLEIPVAALATLNQDAHTRMLAMLNEWILRHKPPTPAK